MFPSRINLATRLTAAAVVLGTLAGCSDIYYDRRESIALSAGDALATDKVTQMVDPWPPYSSNRDIAYNGNKMQTAVERYRTNKVIAPVNATTSSASQPAAAAPAAAAPSKP